MSERRAPIGVLAVVPVVIGMGVWAFSGQAKVEDPASVTATAQAAASQTASAAAARVTPTPTWWVDSPPQWTPIATETSWPTPQAEHGPFHDGAWVRVNAGAGDCLNARNQPSISSEWVIVNVCIPHGHEALITGTTREAEGHWWWELAGLGWVAEEYLTYVREFDARSNTLPDLANKGRVAFLRDRQIWVMDSDGSNQRRIGALPQDDNAWLEGGGLTWSPDGRAIAFNMSRYDPGAQRSTVDFHVLPADGGEERIFADTMGGGWSPDGRLVGIIREAVPEQMGGGNEGLPAVLSLETHGELVLGSERFYQDKPPAFNRDGSLLMVSMLDYDEATQTSSRAIVIYDTDGIERHRVTFPEDQAFASPRWSPTEDRIAMHLWQNGAGRYAAYDVAAAAFVAHATPPSYSTRIGGRCGGGEMWRTTWSADGESVLYSFMWGDTGANGVWVWDVRSGEQRLVVAAGVSGAAPGPEDEVTFSVFSGRWGYIFVGTAAGGLPRILTDGASPAWWYPR